MSLWQNLKERCGFAQNKQELRKEINRLSKLYINMTLRHGKILKHNIECMKVYRVILDSDDSDEIHLLVRNLIKQIPNPND